MIRLPAADEAQRQGVKLTPRELPAEGRARLGANSAGAWEGPSQSSAQLTLLAASSRLRDLGRGVCRRRKGRRRVDALR